MSKTTFDLSEHTPKFIMTEQAINNISDLIPDTPTELIKLIRLQCHIKAQLDVIVFQLMEDVLNQTEWLSMSVMLMCPNHSISPSDLAAALQFSKTNATRILDSLQEKGFITREQCHVDKRKTFAILTPKGLAFLEKYLPQQHQLLKDVFEQVLSQEEQKQYYNLAFKLSGQLESILEDKKPVYSPCLISD
ncbi:MAG: MarR family transcriptional regulator [Neisseriaceae bacterium]|nr:MarR family transcriptional regulator [Neisseriaceae bacterium]MBP6860854.1 MarR family transcriptional regulator [Neisseriaceae bacterium]